MIQLTEQNIKLEFSQERISAHGGLLFYNEFLKQIEFSNTLQENIDWSNYPFRNHAPGSLIKQKVLSLLAGYEDNVDADIVKDDPAFNHCLNSNIASQPTLSRLENFVDKDIEDELIQVNANLVESALDKEGRDSITLDLDSSSAVCCGGQKGADYHGYYQEKMFHPLFLFCGETGDLLRALLRNGSCADIHKATDMLQPVLDQLKDDYRLKFRADAGMNSPKLYCLLEQYEVEYFIRLKSNNVLTKKARGLLPIEKKYGHTDKIRYSSFSYQAETWSRERKVYVKQIYRADQLFPEYYFVLTNTDSNTSEEVFEFYEQRGEVENFIKESKHNFSFDRLSCSKFRANAFRLQTAVLAYNINNIFRRLILPEQLHSNMLCSLRNKIINLGCKFTSHARRIICKFGKATRKDLIEWIVEKLTLFKFSWSGFS